MSTSEQKINIDQIWLQDGTLHITLVCPNYDVTGPLVTAGLGQRVSTAIKSKFNTTRKCSHCKRILNGKYYRHMNDYFAGMTTYFHKCEACYDENQGTWGTWELEGEYLEGRLIKNHI